MDFNYMCDVHTSEIGRCSSGAHRQTPWSGGCWDPLMAALPRYAAVLDMLALLFL